ncbi:MAG: hypothetical protein ACYCPS_06560 [Candidatus Saccharimonadales bacterium]
MLGEVGGSHFLATEYSYFPDEPQSTRRIWGARRLCFICRRYRWNILKGKISFDKRPIDTGHWRNRDTPASKPFAMEACKHPRVRVLTREEDAEFVECLECGEVFDSHEFTDMDIEEKSLKNIEQSEE